MVHFRRYVAVGDSTTEGLVDPDDLGGFRGWADRLAQLIADGQEEPLEYANLAIRSLRLAEIRATQFDQALAMRPDLMTIFGGVNDLLSLRYDFGALDHDYADMFALARARDITVVTFTMPDPSRVNPFGPRLWERIHRLNQVILAEADRYGCLVLDFEQHPVAQDPRLWYEDRLHANTLGHQRVAAAIAWRLGVAGSDLSWADPLPEEPVVRRVRERINAEVDWAVHHLGPWLGSNIRHGPHDEGLRPKRPEPTVVARSRPL